MADQPVLATCAHCGADDLGSEAVNAAEHHGRTLCAPTAPGRPNCYRLVLAFSHPMPCDGVVVVNLIDMNSQATHEQRRAADPGHDDSSCWCCCTDCQADEEAIEPEDAEQVDG